MRTLAIRLAPAVFLVAAAIWSTCRVTNAASSVPSDARWHAAAAAVRTRYQPGDLIVFAPRWVDPVGRLHLGDLIPLEMAGRMDAARYRTIWELSIRGASAPESHGLGASYEASFGGVRVRSFEQTPVDVATDLTARWQEATVTGARARGPSLELAEVGFSPRRCVQIVPAPGQSVKLRWPAVELGRELVGYVGLADVFTRRDVRDPGELEVAVGGKTVAKVRFGVDDGWVRFSAPTAVGTAEVSVTATAVGEGARDRLICFAAEARR